MYFDWTSSKEGVGAGVVVIFPSKQVISPSYKLQFETTNNTTEYESLILGIKEAKYLGVEKIVAFEDSKLVIQHIKNLYQVWKPMLKNYINEVWSLIESSFSSFNNTYISREIN